ncbi:MAG TPA: TRAP transporter small permease [Casimicrobiaceae bacterium]|nr:TRAP transporter small permease [Casimicrobiaceae bacterium]
MERFARGIRLVSRLCGYFAAALIAIGVAVVCEMVFVRFVLNENTIWQTDFVTYSLVAATFIGSPYVLMLRGHVNVDVLPLHLRPRRRYWLAIFSMLAAIAFCVILAILTTQYWLEAWRQHWLSNTMWRVRLWIPYASMPIGLWVLTLQYAAEFHALVTRRAPPFGIVDHAQHGAEGDSRELVASPPELDEAARVGGGGS